MSITYPGREPCADQISNCVELCCGPAFDLAEVLAFFIATWPKLHLEETDDFVRLMAMDFGANNDETIPALA